MQTHEAFERNAKDQYEALGRFVEAFELMVYQVRATCLEILASSWEHAELVDVALNHPVLTSKPLFEIMRALMADTLKQNKAPLKDSDRFFGVLTNIASEYNHLASMRNSLLHGTWSMGIDSDDPNTLRSLVEKYKPTKTGLKKEELPKNAKELIELGKRCQNTRTWIDWCRRGGGWN